MLGVLATCLFYGDAMITPAISVLSAVEGLAVAEAGLQPLILPISIGILVGLFLDPVARNRPRSALFFGPIILVYFAVLAVLGMSNILNHPEILGGAQPDWAVAFLRASTRKLAFLALGSVFLAVTGRRNALRRHGTFRPQGDRAVLADARLPVPDAQLSRPGRAAARRP